MVFIEEDRPKAFIKTSLAKDEKGLDRTNLSGSCLNSGCSAHSAATAIYSIPTLQS